MPIDLFAENTPYPITVVDSRGRKKTRYIDGDGNMMPVPRPPRGGTRRDKTQAKAARQARRKNR